MQAVLYVAHGSRLKAGVAEAIEFIEKVKFNVDAPIQEICFLELAEPGISEGISKCVERGASHIAIIPILLLTAVHAKKDIPEKIEVGKQIYPHVRFTYGTTIGVHPKIIESLYDRIIEKKTALDADAVVLLVGRGSSDPLVKQDLTRIGNLLKKNYSFQQVEVSFLYGASPHVDEALNLLLNSAKKQIFVIPYLLFSGLLKNGVEKKIKRLSDPNHSIILCDSIGDHPNIQEVIAERVKEAIETERVG
ncbi:MAG TPA: sirohydrochlorin chelatase [Bacillus bacterium]|uniref:sirohydrochlorin chelatase n=1 Tax=Siminovitchia fordii TaxID=254759 RepID=UPI000360F9F6|nr:sirohydrochlorin chelatase [Siminovitchia fordii]HBZ08304.1 sirohydrochlorin chelatase [Bacillus sp. (in: firmicutes)]